MDLNDVPRFTLVEALHDFQRGPAILPSKRRHASDELPSCESVHAHTVSGCHVLQFFDFEMHGLLTVCDPDLPLLNRALQLHRALGEPCQFSRRMRGKAHDTQVSCAFQFRGNLVPPDIAGAAVAVDEDLR